MCRDSKCCNGILTVSSVRQLSPDRGNQAHHQGQRDYKVGEPIAICGVVNAADCAAQGRRFEMAAEE